MKITASINQSQNPEKWTEFISTITKWSEDHCVREHITSETLSHLKDEQLIKFAEIVVPEEKNLILSLECSHFKLKEDLRRQKTKLAKILFIHNFARTELIRIILKKQLAVFISELKIEFPDFDWT